MILYTNGCSYTWGDELESPKEQAWPYVLGDLLSATDVISDASCGISNDCILRTSLDFLTDKLYLKLNGENLLVVIMWTYLGRFDYYDDIREQFVTIAPHGTTKQDRSVADQSSDHSFDAFTLEIQDPDEEEPDDGPDDDHVRPWRNSWMSRWLSFQRKDIDEVYAGYMNICSDKWDAWRHFQHALCLQNFLEAKNIKYVFCNVGYEQREGEFVYSQPKNLVTNQLPDNYIQQIDKRTYPCFTDSSLGMSQYTSSNGGGQCPNGHPDAKSHVMYAEHLADTIKRL